MRTVGSAPSPSSTSSFDRDTPSSVAAAGTVSNLTWLPDAGVAPASGEGAVIRRSTSIPLLDASSQNEASLGTPVMHAHEQVRTPLDGPRDTRPRSGVRWRQERPDIGALIDAGSRRSTDLPDDLDELRQLHGVGLSAVRRLHAVRERR